MEVVFLKRKSVSLDGMSLSNPEIGCPINIPDGLVKGLIEAEICCMPDDYVAIKKKADADLEKHKAAVKKANEPPKKKGKGKGTKESLTIGGKPAVINENLKKKQGDSGTENKAMKLDSLDDKTDTVEGGSDGSSAENSQIGDQV